MHATVMLFGGVRLRESDPARPDRIVESRRSAIVLAQLAIDAGRPIRGEDLARSVWSDSQPATWNASLRNTIADLRALLAAGTALASIVATGVGYQLDLVDGVTVDVRVVLDAVAKATAELDRGHAEGTLATVERSTALAGRPFLDGIESVWVSDMRRRLHAADAALALLGARAALEVGKPARAEQHARRAVAADELREDGHRLLVEALAASGNRAAALEAYTRCRNLLAQQLGVDPSAATQALFQSLLADDPEPDSAVESAARPLLLMRAMAPFVGRRPELDRVDALFDSTRRRGCLVVQVEGEPGIGKTRFAAEVAERMRRRGAPAMYGRADDRIDIPDRPLMEALDGYLSLLAPPRRLRLLGRHAPHLARLLPSIRDVLPSVGLPSGRPDLDRDHLATALGDVLAAVARPTGAVLILDDMQWSSQPTLELVGQLSTSLPATALLIMVLRRSGSAAQPAPLDAVGARVVLGGLSLPDLEDLAVRIATEVGARPTSQDVRSVWSDTAGNPLYASEILRASAWAPTPGATIRRTERLRELVVRRVANLTAGTRRWLDVAAVAGLEFEPDLVSTAAGLTRPEAAAAVAAVQAHGLVTPATSNPARRAFRHALVRQCLLDELAADTRSLMAIHDRLGSVLETRDGTSTSLLAHHANAAAPLGSWRRAARYGLAGAEAAADSLVHDDAIAICRATLSVLAEAGDPDPVARRRLHVILGTALRATGDSDGDGDGDGDGERILTAAFDEALAAGDTELAARAALGLTPAGSAGDEMAADRRHLALYERALAALGDGAPQLRAALLGRLSTGYGWLQNGEAARVYAAQSLALAREVGDVATLMTVLVSTRRGLSGTGNPDRERAIEDELLALAADLDDPRTATATWLWRFESAIESGDGQDLEAALARADAHASELSAPSQRYTAAYSDAALLLVRGYVDAADAATEKAFTLGQELGVDPLVCGGIRMIQLMGVRHEQGRLGEIRDELADYFGRAGVPEWEGTVAFADTELGRLDALDGYLRKVFDGYAARGVRAGVGVGFAAHMAGPVARAGDSHYARTLYDMLLPYRGQGSYISYFAGPVDYALGLLARTLGRTAQAHRHLNDARDFCVRLGAPRWTARCEAALGGPPPRSDRSN